VENLCAFDFPFLGRRYPKIGINEITTTKSCRNKMHAISGAGHYCHSYLNIEMDLSICERSFVHRRNYDAFLDAQCLPQPVAC
jgi:hypothetical protein